MPIQLRRVGKETRPVIVCDHCGAVISNAGQGRYGWRVDEAFQLESGELVYLHKKCEMTYIELHKVRNTWRSIELECLPIYLATNLELDWERAAHTARITSEL